MILIRNSRFINECYAYSSRELFLATCIKVEADVANLSAGEYHYRIVNSYLEDNAHCAVYAAGTSSSTYCVVQFDGDTIKVDSRNRRYTSNQGTGASNTNAYGIQYTYGGPGCYIKNCVITSGTRYHGGRGIQLVRANGTQSNPLEIAYNRVDVHEGLNVEFGTLYYGCGVKIRQNSRGVWLHHNAIIYTCDTTQAIGRPYQPKGEALMYQMGFDAGGSYTGPYYITMENNACSTKIITNVNDPDYELSVVDFETCEYADNTVIYRNNKMYSSGNHVYNFGQYDGGGSYLRLSGDTAIINSSSAINPKWTFNPGDYRGAFDNWATDFTFSPTTADTSITYEFQNNMTGSGTQNIKLRRTVSVYVRGNNGLPVVAANVTLRNAYGQSVLSGTTNNGGRVTGPVSYWYEARTSADSVGFNNFTATATIATFSASHSFAVRWNSYRDTLTLTGLAGTGTWETGGSTDVMAPSAITTLSAVSGSGNTSVILGWTAVGDDGLFGTATSYDVRYSTSTITEGNWSAATQATGEPTPLAAGAVQALTVSGLSATTSYYFTVKVADESGNVSSLSNVASRIISTDVTPPAAVSNLAATNGTGGTSVVLNWTATGDDGTTGTATSYDVRYSTSNITEANWAAATQATGEPVPQAAGTAQALTVSGLSASTSYYFAAKVADERSNLSALSNVASRIILVDVTAPSAIGDLGVTVGSVNTSKVLSWTAPGDDGGTGTATSYDVRYSISPITDANWGSATQATGEPTPRAAGGLESFTITGFSSTTIYYFAVKTADEANNISALSNVVAHSGTTDVTPPNKVTDLGALPGDVDGTITLTWSAPGDDGGAGTATAYDIRFSTQPVNEGNWSAASLVSAPPAPLPARAIQTMTLGDLTPGVIYYAGIVAVDEIGNTSELSNVASATAKITIVTGDSVNVTQLEPTDYAVISDLNPILIVLNVDTVATDAYRFQVATDSAFSGIVATSPAVTQQAGFQTAWQVSPALQTGQDYFWRVNVNDGPYGGFATFTVDVATKAYPNPFRLAEGSQVTFTGVPAGSNLILLTSSGDMVRRWPGTTGSDIIWNGRNDSGQDVASGIYLWYVESSEIKGKLIVIR